MMKVAIYARISTRISTIDKGQGVNLQLNEDKLLFMEVINMINEEQMHKKVISLLNEIPKLPIETSFGIIGRDEKDLMFTEIILGNKSEVAAPEFNEDMIGTCHTHPISKNKQERRLNSTPSPQDVLVALDIGKGLHYSLNYEDMSIYVLKPFKKINESELKGIWQKCLSIGRELINSNHDKRIKLLMSIADNSIEIKKLQ